MKMHSILVAGLALCVLGATGCVAASAARDDRPYILAGTPKAPVEAVGGDWFTRNRSDESSFSPTRMRQAIGTRIYLRGVESAPTTRPAGSAPEPVGAFVQENQVENGAGRFSGYTIKYSDRIMVVVNPSDVPYQLGQRLATEDATTTTGKSRLWTAVRVRGVDGAYRAQATQRWESGDVNRMPAVLEWGECTTQAPGYVTVAIVGDASLSTLQSIAAGLVLR